jgi:putative FmdB family regulatory protein
MPVYEYRCECDDAVVPVTMSIADYQPKQVCKKCGQEMGRHYTPTGIQFKGNGFYKTDNPK